MRLYSALTVLALILYFGVPSPVFATTYSSAMNAYERQDYYTAAKEFSELAEQGNPYAQFMLGRMYASGEGVRRNYKEAYAWLHLADRGGVEEAAPLKKQVGKKLSRKKISQAKEQAESWQRQVNANTTDNQPVADRALTDKRIVRQVQQKLKEHGYYFGKIDGISGPGTSNAIMIYQHAQGMQKDGRITEPLLQHMGIDPIVTENKSETSQDAEFTQMKKELRSLIGRIKKTNSAEPWVINRLEQLAGGTSSPWPHLVLHENFQDNNYTGGDAWRVIDGSFRFEPGKGLVGTANASWGKNTGIDELAIDLIDVLINKKDPVSLTREMAQIESSQSFTNSFQLKVRTGPLQETQGLLFSCAANSTSPGGYQLAFHPGQGERAKLFRVSGNSVTEIPATISPIRFATNSDHTFVWSRTTEGDITFTVDGQRLLFAANTDSSPTNFDTLTVTHLGKEVTFREIQLKDRSDN